MNIFLVESNGSLPPCPICGGNLHHRDRRLRIREKEGGEVQWLKISRAQCEECHHYHSVLPDCITPYKHYETEVISGVLDGIITPDDQDAEDYPSMLTMIRWLAWFQASLNAIEGYLRRAAYLLKEFADSVLTSGQSLLDYIRKNYRQWMEIVQKIIYNSGGFLPTFRD